MTPEQNSLMTQRLIEGMKSADANATNITKWLIGSLLTTNTAGLYFSLKSITEGNEHSSILSVVAFAFGGLLALMTAFFSFMNAMSAKELFETLLYQSQQEREKTLEDDEIGKKLDHYRLAGIIFGFISAACFGIGIALLALKI